MKHLARLATVVGMLVGWTPSFVPSNAAEPAATAPKTAVRESFTIDPDDLAVLVPVRVGDKDYRFMLDTGASGSTFDVSLRAQLGPRVGSVSVQDAFGPRTMTCTLPPKLGSAPCR